MIIRRRRINPSEQPMSPTQRRCIIEATIEPLLPYRKGFARSKSGPFFIAQTVDPLIRSGHLRPIHRGVHIILTARAA
jgi:hypothetical protein